MDRERNREQTLEGWNQKLDIALKNLPERSAPADLLPQVMAKIQAQRDGNKPWLLWRHWPLWLRISSAALVLTFVILLSLVGIRLYESSVIPAFTLVVHTCKTVFDTIAGIFIDNRTGIGRTVFQYILPAVSFLLLGMYLTFIGLGTFLYRTVRR